MAMHPKENIRDFLGRLNKVNTIILDAYQGYTLALLPDLKRVINLQPKHTLDLDTAVHLA